MATLIFGDQENGDVASATLLKARLKQSSSGKVFGSCGTLKPRKALGNVNKQVIQTSVSFKKDALKTKTSAPVTQQFVSLLSLAIAIFEGLPPQALCNATPVKAEHMMQVLVYLGNAFSKDFETYDLPEEYKLGNLYLAGVPLVVHENDADKLDALLNREPVPLDIPVFDWESDMSSTLPSFLATIDDITQLAPVELLA